MPLQRQAKLLRAKTNTLLFGGRFNPYLDNESDTTPIYLAKQSQDPSTVYMLSFEERLTRSWLYNAYGTF